MFITPKEIADKYLKDISNSIKKKVTKKNIEQKTSWRPFWLTVDANVASGDKK